VTPDAAGLLELAEKYRALAALRARRDAAQGGSGSADEPTAAQTRAILRGLAERYPGCLRELDTLGAAEIERRAAMAAAAASGGPREPWMAWVWAFHQLMRATLVLRRAPIPSDPTARAQVLGETERLAGFALDDDFLSEVARPPQRRLAVVVFRRLSRLFAVPAAEIAETLFPTRRPSPYSLA
jgi:hypothetical protein